MKELIVRIRLGEKGDNQGLLIEERMRGNWSYLEEMAVFDVLRQRAFEKINKKFDVKKGGKNDRGTEGNGT